MKLILGDCLEQMRQLEDQSIDSVLTSPPYNRKRNDKYDHYTDIKEDWYEWNCQVIDRLLQLTKNYIFYNVQINYYNRVDVYKMIGRYAENIKEIIVWEKSNPLPAPGFNITNAVEYFLVLGNKSLKSNKTYTKNIITTSVNSKMPKDHKAVMKQEVADYMIWHFTKPDDIILDPFMGIGTTGISCAKYQRDFIGIELSPVYFKMAQERLGCGNEKYI